MTTTPTLPVAAGPALTLGGRRYPVLLPRVRDPRLHVAAVIITVQVLGQTVLGFDVSIAQILIAIGTAAVLELGFVAVTKQVLAWPASALLTGNGVALLLRTPGTEHGDWWSTRGWPIFVAAAGISLLSKYAIRVGDRHLFNPSNFGLVVVFLVFGSDRADPQDLWWGPWRPALALTLAVIVLGGITLSMRLRLFSVAITFWVSFAACVAVLAASGHAITARWHLGPLDGWAYWAVLVASPEIAIFVFFMITDPRTAPEGRAARPVYAAAVGVLAGVLVGLQTTEFATKVSLLAALTVVCAARPYLERRLAPDRFTPPAGWALVRAVAPVAVVSVALVLLATTIAGSPAALARPTVVAVAAGDRPSVDLPAGAVPTATISDALAAVPGAISDADAQRIARDLVENLAIEAQALRDGSAAVAATAAFGPHLVDLQRQLATARRTGRTTVTEHRIDELEVVLLQDPVRPQAVPQLGVRAVGQATELVYSGDPLVLEDQTTAPLTAVYLVTELDGHHLIGEVLPADSPMLVDR